MKKAFKIAICQMNIRNDKNANLDKACEMVNQATDLGCNMAVLPEMFNCPYVTANFPDYAEPVPDGNTSIVMRNLAQRNGIYLVGGSIPESDGEGHVYNTSTVFSPEGQMIARHRKLHLFDVSITGGISFRESDTLTRGQEITTFETEFCHMGLAICYDLRFPELSRLMVNRGAEVLIFPAAFNTTTGPAHWELLLRSRAVDNQVWVVAAAPAYDSNFPYPIYGHSLVVNPWGTVTAMAGSDETLVIADIDLQMVSSIREELPLIKHQRRDIYLLREI
ncbi:MAG: carbon-nitrogen hydrolase family protein [Chitinophagales bacterium]